VVDYSPLSEEDILSAPTSKVDGREPLSEADIAASAKREIPTQPLTPEQRKEQIVRNVPLGLGDVAGTPGSLGQLWDLGKEKIAEYAIARPLEKFGLLPKGRTAEELMQTFRDVSKDFQSPEEQRGEVNKIYGIPFPTASGIEEKMKANIPALAKEPQTPEEEEFGQKIRMGTGVAPGGGGLLATAGRFGAGYLGSTIGQEAQKLQERTGFFAPGSAAEKYLEPAASVLGTIGAQAIGGKLRNVAFPSKAAEEGVSAAIAADIRSGQFNKEAFEAAVQSGEPYRLVDYFGEKSKLRQYLSEEAGKSGKTGQQLLEDFNAEVSNVPGTTVKVRLPEAQQRTNAFLEQVNRGPIDAGYVARITKEAGEKAQTAIYDALHEIPEAYGIPRGMFGQDVLNNEFVQNSVNRVMNMEVPAQWKVVKPKSSPEVAPQLIEYDAAGQPVMSAGRQAIDTPGNLAFWDLVKRDMDLQIRKAEMAGTESYDTLKASSMKDARKNLVDDLDFAVTEYPKVRASSGELFGRDTAPEAGMEFYKRMDSISRDEAIQNLRQLSPEAQKLFKTGWMNELSSNLSGENGMTSVANKFVGNPDFQRNARIILGRDYDMVRGRILSENARLISKQIKPVQSTSVLGKTGISAIGAGSAGFIAPTVENLVTGLQQSMFLPPKDLGAVLLGTVAAGTIGGAAGLQSRRVADRAVKLMLSDKPADHVRLSRLMDADPVTAKAIFRLNTAVQTIRADQEKQAEEETSSNPPDQLPPLTISGPGNRTGRATGGRIGSHDAAADRLVRMADAAKKNIGKQTESILNAPDEHVVKALAVANRNLEG
jgi:hypothetical protein